MEWTNSLKLEIDDVVVEKLQQTRKYRRNMRTQVQEKHENATTPEIPRSNQTPTACSIYTFLHQRLYTHPLQMRPIIVPPRRRECPLRWRPETDITLHCDKQDAHDVAEEMRCKHPVTDITDIIPPIAPQPSLGLKLGAMLFNDASYHAAHLAIKVSNIRPFPVVIPMDIDGIVMEAPDQQDATDTGGDKTHAGGADKPEGSLDVGGKLDVPCGGGVGDANAGDDEASH